MCREQCEKQRLIWDECVAEIALDDDAKAAFDVQMADLASLAVVGNIYFGQALPESEPWNSFAFPSCDVSANPAEISVPESANAFFFGSWQSPAHVTNYHMNFPMNMSTEDLFPVRTSTWTHTDGVGYDVQCFIPGRTI
jgi:hypothetical protein